MYLEHLPFLINRAGWKVTEIHAYLTFEQKRFKKKIILMNQKSRQLSKNNIEKDFYELMNNSNFGYNCWNNFDNCQIVPIFDEFKEITYIGRYFNFFDPRVAKFVTGDLIHQEIEEKYNDDKLIKLDKENRFYAIKLNSLNAEGLSSLEAAENVDKRKKKNKRNLNLIDYAKRKDEAFRNQEVR